MTPQAARHHTRVPPAPPPRRAPARAPVVQAGARAVDAHDAAERDAVQRARGLVTLAPSPGHHSPRRHSPAQDRFDGLVPAQGRGEPLPVRVRTTLEPALGASLAGVRIHTDARAAQSSRQLSAAAFTLGQHVFFAEGQFQPDTPDGRELIAHELVHTLQQRDAPEPTLQRLGLDDVRSWFAQQAARLPGWRLLTLLLGRDPILGTAVPGGASAVLQEALAMLPLGAALAQALARHGQLARAGALAQSHVAAGIALALRSVTGIAGFFRTLQPTDVLDPAGLWARASRLVSGPAQEALALARSLQQGVVTLLRDAVLLLVATALNGTAAYPLLCLLLGRDPLTGTPCARSAERLIGGFMQLIGRGDVWQQLLASGAVARAAAWFDGASQGLVALGLGAVGRARALWTGLSLGELLQPVDLIGRVAGLFTDTLAALGRWAGEAAWSLLELVAEVWAPGLLSRLRRLGVALRSLLADPVGAGRNMLQAITSGLRQFASKLLQHLGAGLLAWLRDSGLEAPRADDPASWLRFAAGALRLGWTQALRPRLVRLVGEAPVRLLERGSAAVQALMCEGPVALWTQLRGLLAGWPAMLLRQIIGWVSASAMQAVARLLALLAPAGSTLLTALRTMQATLQFVSTQFAVLGAAVGGALVDTLATVAGDIGVRLGSAAQAIERMLARVLPSTLGLLMQLLGLGRIGDAIRRVVETVRGFVERQLDTALGWLLRQARAGIATVGSLSGRVRRVLGVTYFRSHEGRWEALPTDLSAEDAVRLESEGLAAQQRIDSSPPARLPALPPRPALRAAVSPVRAQRPRRTGARRPGARALARAAALAQAAARGWSRSIAQRPVARHLAEQGLPALTRGMAVLQQLKRHEQTHDSAAQKRSQAESAVLIPRSEEQSQGNAGQVQDVAVRQAPAPDVTRARGSLTEGLLRHMPRNLQALDRFRQETRAQRIGAGVAPRVHADKDGVLATFGAMRQVPEPVPSGQVPQPLPAPETAPTTPPLQLAPGLIAALRPEHLDTRPFTREADRQLADEGITQQQLDMVDSGDLALARRQKQGLEQTAVREPAAATQFVQTQTRRLQTSLVAEEQRERRAIGAGRRQRLTQSQRRQRDAKAALERQREAVASHINARFEAARRSVTARLESLERESLQRFDAGNARAAQAFEQDVQRELAAYKADRYSGFFGKLRRLRDWWKGMDELPAVKAIFERHRRVFVDTVQALVETIAADNRRVVQGCKDELTQARQAIERYVAGLSPALQGIGQRTAGEIGERLQALDAEVAKREETLRQQLQDKQQAAIQAIDQKIEQMKADMAGALSKLKRLLLWAAKKFFSWALSQFGYSLSEIESIISRGAAVLKAIFTQPVAFVRNLVRAARGGFERFATHFGRHLKDALFEWLTGSLTGLTLPTVWNTRGVLSVALQVLRLTGDAVRRRLLLQLGGDSQLLARIEQATPLVRRVLAEGPAAAWDEIKAEAAEVEREAVERLRRFVEFEIVKQAVKTLVQMFVPGAGLVRAAVGIYDTIVFFIRRAADIARMVGGFLASIGEIAAGNIDAAAGSLETGLARALRLVIDFLARFLRLNGIPARIRAVIEAVAGRAQAVVDRVVRWIVGLVKRGGQKVVGGAKRAIAAVTQWWRERKPFGSGRERHTLHFTGEGAAARLAVSSRTKTIRDFVEQDVKPRIPASHPKASLLPKIMAQVRIVEREVGDGAFGQQAGEDIATALNKIAGWLGELIGEVPESQIDTQVTRTRKLHDGSVVGERMLALPLSQRPGRLSGSAPFGVTPTWTAVNRRVHAYVRGHLLNHHLYGAGSNENMVPIARTLNSQMSAQMEEDVKTAVRGEGKVLAYTVNFQFDGHAGTRQLPQELELPSAVKMAAHEVEAAGNGWKRKPGGYTRGPITLRHVLPPDDHPIDARPVLVRLSVNRPWGQPGQEKLARQALASLHGVGDKRAELLLAHLGAAPGAAPFKAWSDVDAVLNVSGISSEWASQENEDSPPKRLAYLDGETVWKMPS